jgi:hypothetical protein
MSDEADILRRVFGARTETYDEFCEFLQVQPQPDTELTMSATVAIAMPGCTITDEVEVSAEIALQALQASVCLPEKVVTAEVVLDEFGTEVIECVETAPSVSAVSGISMLRKVPQHK